MASEKYYEVMRTDFEAEASKSINNIFDTYNQTIELVNQDDLTLFDLDRQLSVIRWAENKMAETLDDFNALIQRRNERKLEKLNKEQEKARAV